jgi:hypothetical protein
MTVDFSAAIRDIGVSDMRAMSIDPRQADLSEWRAARLKRGCSVSQALARENRGMSATGQRGATARTANIGAIKAARLKPTPATATRTEEQKEAKRISHAIGAATRRARHEMWESEQELRFGLISPNRADAVMHAGHGTVRNAIRAGQLSAAPVYSSSMGRPIDMVRLADVLEWANRR